MVEFAPAPNIKATHRMEPVTAPYLVQNHPTELWRIKSFEAKWTFLLLKVQQASAKNKHVHSGEGYCFIFISP